MLGGPVADAGEAEAVSAGQAVGIGHGFVADAAFILPKDLLGKSFSGNNGWIFRRRAIK